MYNWTLDSGLNSSYKDINFFTFGLCRALECNDDHVAINLSQLGFINGELTTILLLGMRQLEKQNKTVKLVGVKPAQRDILERNGFYKAIGEKNKPDNKNTTIQLQEFNISNNIQIDEYINTILKPKLSNYSKNAPQNEQAAVDEMISSVRYAIDELIDNIKTHSESDVMYFAGQFFPRQKRLSFTILDAGLTIPTIVRDKFNNLKSQAKSISDFLLIDWATEQGNTTKDVKKKGIPGGAGLYTVKTSLKGHGELTIVSGNGFWKLTSSKKIMHQSLFEKFPGTLIHVTFILDSHTIDKEDSPLSLLF